MADELLCNVLRGKIQIYYHDFFLNFYHHPPLILMEIIPFCHYYGHLPHIKWAPLGFVWPLNHGSRVVRHYLRPYFLTPVTDRHLNVFNYLRWLNPDDCFFCRGLYFGFGSVILYLYAINKIPKPWKFAHNLSTYVLHASSLCDNQENNKMTVPIAMLSWLLLWIAPLNNVVTLVTLIRILFQ